MKSTIVAFEKKVEQLENYLSSWQRAKEDVSKAKGQNIELPASICDLLNNTTKRIFDYKLSILILYGAFENFIENMISSYLGRLQQMVSSYDRLPKEIKDHHTERSAKLLGYICSGYSKYDNVSIENVVQGMYLCVSKNNAYQLNIPAFTHHSSNLRMDTVRELFNGIGIKGIDKIILDSNFQDGIIDDMMGSLTKEELEDAKFQKLSELVERRNDIAHGVEDADENILKADMIETDYCRYLKVLARLIYRAVLREYAALVIKENADSCCLGKPIEVYNNRIVCLSNQNKRIACGNYLVGQNDVGELRVGEIQSLQVDNCPVRSVSSEELKNIGKKVDFRAKKKFTYYVFQ